ncbi:MAG: hypothetical protein JXR97_06025 [Planctomycetes bacterium]|nr:hypothetical protein [Planctomycetota bacterium]
MSGFDVVKVVAGVMASLGGGGAVVLAFSSFLGKLWSERLLEKERHEHRKEMQAMQQEGGELLEGLRIQANRDSLVHRLQFEKEFSLYEEIWGPLSNMALSLDVSRIVLFNTVASAENKTNRLHKTIKELDVFFEDYKRIVLSKKPFYPPELFDVLRKIEYLLADEYTDLLRSVSDGVFNGSPDAHKKMLETLKELNSFIDKVSEIIRSRIWLNFNEQK